MSVAVPSAFGIGLICAWLSVAHQRQDEADTANRLAMERYDAAKQIWDDAVRRGGLGDPAIGNPQDEEYYRWSLRLAESAAAAGILETKDAFHAHASRMRKLEEKVRSVVPAGRRPSAELSAVQYFIADAELRALEVKR